ncbi:ACP S-malonyltransferase [Microbulbifer sp. ZKSA006]|uniref:ACP S-malonyltransferase n=1 Tax=Microbulbifer sp. ZKSA006 TaxID=3243390 RepID=UPI00403938A8
MDFKPMKPVYVFPGQGSQHRGMGKDLFDKYPELVEQADEQLGYSIKELCLSDPDRVLNKTEYTQPALYTVTVLSYLDRVKNGGMYPEYVAGHSLGEYCALFSAGAFDFITGLKLVQKRGELMGRAGSGGMAAIVNVDQQRVKEILAGLSFGNIEVANINSKFQCIISGLYDDVFSTEVETVFEDAGAQVVPLNVRTAFHSRYMDDAQKEFEVFLSGFDLLPLKITVISNYTARPYPSDGYKKYMSLQISHPVKWYESISWLIARGYTDFEELGPGDVLTKLSKRIVDAPLEIESEDVGSTEVAGVGNDKSRVSTASGKGNNPKIIFMYGGQGSQYYHMGKELFDTNEVFRKNMLLCSDKLYHDLGISLVDIIYPQSKHGGEFDNIIYSHPALFAIGYSLTQTLLDKGVEPFGVLGYSLGEYIAATISGAISLDDGLNLVLTQARLLQSHCREGGVLSVLDSADIFRRRSDIFLNATLGGVNFSNSFFVSGLDDELRDIKLNLNREEIASVRLPVRYGFHSDAIDSIRDEFLAYASGICVSHPIMPVYSTACTKKLNSDVMESFASYLWNVVRNETNFNKLIENAFNPKEDYTFVDLSPTATLSTFLKHGFGNGCQHDYAINPFGRNNETLEKLVSRLAI